MASHVSQCMAKPCMCDTWQAICVTHGMPCVNMHGSFEAYIRGFTWAVLTSKGAASISSWEQQGEGGGREKRKGGKEKRKGGKERRKGGKEKERKEEKRRRNGRKRGKGSSVAQSGDLDCKELGTTLREVDFLLL